MKHRPKLHLHIGLRTFKTALAVTIALLIAGALDSYSPISVSYTHLDVYKRQDAHHGAGAGRRHVAGGSQAASRASGPYDSKHRALI